MKRFQRRIEDFVCAHCGVKVVGDGYTNHCPQCLWSKHVDINPGDRAATCGGLMEPIRVDGGSGEYRLVHLCHDCGIERRNKMEKGDDINALITLAAEQG
ncbi:MAG: hypothetical protein UY63_C0001G0034 [Parcubacteria group bacterium GW2011_GWA2_51_10]|nr:MAG: hypothetical protein UY63_C0001G0034 [Parcubacteria group bacterium GW2011_GWA2_51_10]